MAQTDMVEVMAMVSAKLWIVLMFLESVEDNIRLPCRVNSSNQTFRTLIDPSWPLEGSEMVSFGAVQGWLILDATPIEIRLSGYFGGKSVALLKQCLQERSMI